GERAQFRQRLQALEYQFNLPPHSIPFQHFHGAAATRRYGGKDHDIAGVLQCLGLRFRSSLLRLPFDMAAGPRRSLLALANGTQSPANAAFGSWYPNLPIAFHAGLLQLSNLCGQPESRSVFAKQWQSRSVQSDHHCGALAVQRFYSTRLAKATVR